MGVVLLIAEGNDACHAAADVWRGVARDYTIPLEVLDVAGPAGRVLLERLNLRTVPAVVVNGELVAVGVQSRDEALLLLGLDAEPEGAFSPPRSGGG